MTTLIDGGCIEDVRGTIRFANDFNFPGVCRFYCVSNTSEHPFRGWVGHQYERKWFFPTRGQIRIHVVKLDAYDCPSQSLPVETYLLDANKPQVLALDCGYAISIEICTSQAEVMVFSDKTLEEAESDTYRYPPNYWRMN